MLQSQNAGKHRVVLQKKKQKLEQKKDKWKWSPALFEKVKATSDSASLKNTGVEQKTLFFLLLPIRRELSYVSSHINLDMRTTTFQISSKAKTQKRLSTSGKLKEHLSLFPVID